MNLAHICKAAEHGGLLSLLVLRRQGMTESLPFSFLVVALCMERGGDFPSATSRHEILSIGTVPLNVAIIF